MPIVTIEEERLRRKLARLKMKQRLRLIVGGKDTGQKNESTHVEGNTDIASKSQSWD